MSTEKTGGKQIKEIRLASGLSQQKFADQWHIPMRTVQNWECGVSRVPEYYLLLLQAYIDLRKEYEKLHQFAFPEPGLPNKEEES